MIKLRYLTKILVELEIPGACDVRDKD